VEALRAGVLEDVLDAEDHVVRAAQEPLVDLVRVEEPGVDEFAEAFGREPPGEQRRVAGLAGADVVQAEPVAVLALQCPQLGE
jgi:hypothetical protein